MRYLEEQYQSIVVRHVKIHFPDVLFTCAPAAAKSVIQGARNKRLGLLKGWPDLFFAKPMNGYHGLFIEMKTEKGSVKTEQQDIIDRLNSLGYKAIVCFSADDAIKEIISYLTEKKEE